MSKHERPGTALRLGRDFALRKALERLRPERCFPGRHRAFAHDYRPRLDPAHSTISGGRLKMLTCFANNRLLKIEGGRHRAVDRLTWEDDFFSGLLFSRPGLAPHELPNDTL